MWPRSDVNIVECDKNSLYKFNMKCSGNVHVNFSSYGDLFFEAADKITEHILERCYTVQLDCYFFPVAYLYRHSIELKLKAIAFKNNSGAGAEFIRDTFHNLSKILKYISSNVTSQINADRYSYEWLESLFDDMDQIDKDSDAFRYPFKIRMVRDEFESGKNYVIQKFFEGQKHIDLVTFVNKMKLTFKILCSYYNDEKKVFSECREYNTIFLEEGGEFYYQSVIGYDYGNEFYGPMVKGYIEAAEYLFDEIMKTPELKDRFFLPMCYLFRNGLELELKQIWFEQCGALFKTRCEKLYNSKHSFEKMWKLIQEDLSIHTEYENDKSVIGYAEQYIKQFHSLDCSSSVFRYPVDKNVKYHFKRDKYLDVENVGECFIEVSEFLQSIDAMMDDHNQYLADMEAEYAGE